MEPAPDAGAVVARLSGLQLVNGAYYRRLSPVLPNPRVSDQRAAARLLKLTTKLTGTH